MGRYAVVTDPDIVQACARTLSEVQRILENMSRPEQDVKVSRSDNEYVVATRPSDGELLTHRLTDVQKRISMTHESLMTLRERLGMVLLPDPGEAGVNAGEDSPVTSDLGRELLHIGDRIEGLNSLVQHILQRVDL